MRHVTFRRATLRNVILDNARVHTMDDARPTASALAIRGDCIVALGSGPSVVGVERIDLDGLWVLPGLSDAHVHFPTWSLARREVRLDGARSLEEVVARVAAVRGVSSTMTGWIRGRGWRSGDWRPQVEPTRHDLDAVNREVPIALMAQDGHSLWLNSAALARANGDLHVQGGVVELDSAGEPAGVLREEAAWHFRDLYLQTPFSEYVDAMREAIAVAHARGVTAIHDKDGWIGALAMFEQLRDEGSLTLRVWQSLPHERLDELEANGMTSGDGDDFLRVGYVKVFMDGTLGSRTARLLDGSGVEMTSASELAAIVARASRAGFPVAVHAIGDAANRDALDGFAATRCEWRLRGLRQRVEHAQRLAAGDVERFADVGVTASVQFAHAPADRDLADRFWAGETDRSYCYRALLDAGARLANGSDAPVEELDPLRGIKAGVARTLDERAPWHPEQAITIDEALRATTVAPAWLAYDEDRRGRLLPGMFADLVVLDRDPYETPAEELDQIEVVATMVGGEWAHGGDFARRR